MGIQKNDNPTLIEQEFKSSIESCKNHGLNEESRQVQGIYERLVDFYIKTKQFDKGIEVLVYNLNGCLNEKQADFKRCARLGNELGEILLLNKNKEGAVLSFQWTLEYLLGRITSLNSLVDCLRKDYGDDYASWINESNQSNNIIESEKNEPQENGKNNIIKNDQNDIEIENSTKSEIIKSDTLSFKPASWTTSEELITATENYASCIENKIISIQLYHKCIKHIHDEFTMKSKPLTPLLEKQLIVLCTHLSNDFNEMGRIDQGYYWAKEAYEHINKMNQMNGKSKWDEIKENEEMKRVVEDNYFIVKSMYNEIKSNQINK